MDWIEFEIGRKEKYTVLIDKQDAWIFKDYYVRPHLRNEHNKIVCRARCYRKKNNPRKKQISITSLIFKVRKGFVIDHKNGEPLDNRRLNLRYATTGQNSQNRVQSGIRAGKKMSSRFKGVVWRKDMGKWRSTIRCEKKVYYLGYYDSEIEAARAYDKKALELHKEFANLNFKKKKLLKRF